MSPPLTPVEIEVELARRRWRKYEFAARVQIHPSILGRMLAGRLPIPPALTERIRRVFEATRSE